MKSGLKFILTLLFVFALCTCIDPYFPNLKSYEPILVVDGLITNENKSFIIRLSYSIQESDAIPEKVSDAIVYISDETGTISNLTSTGDGIYKTDSLLFKGVAGKIYQLHIETNNGNRYASDSCRMLPVSEIDSIYFGRDVKLLNNQTISRQGISLYLDSKPGISSRSFLRWEFDETWRFKVPFPKKYNYLNDSTILLLPASEVKEFGWKNDRSTEILTGEILPGGPSLIKKKSINFISPELSDRLSIRYSILIKQYSISQKEYDFWNNLREVNETKGDIFGSQPFAVLSNIRNINNPSVHVLGYFKVSAVKTKRKYINFEEVVPLNLPLYNYRCKWITMSPSEYPLPSVWTPLPTFDELYTMFTNVKGYAFIEPVYNTGALELKQLVFTTAECSDCELTGTSTKPDFWLDN